MVEVFSPSQQKTVTHTREWILDRIAYLQEVYVKRCRRIQQNHLIVDLRDIDPNTKRSLGRINEVINCRMRQIGLIQRFYYSGEASSEADDQ